MKKTLLTTISLLLLFSLTAGCKSYEGISEGGNAESGATKVYITTNGNEITGPDDEYQDGVGIKIAPSLRVQSRVALSNSLDTTVEIRGKGKSFATAEKKSYNIKFPEKVALLKRKLRGMDAKAEKAKKYTLSANKDVQELLNTKAAYLIADELKMDWHPTVEAVELYVDGEPCGSYMLTDRLDSISKMTDFEDKETLDYGYLVALGTENDDSPDFTTKEFEIPVNIEIPDSEDYDGKNNDNPAKKAPLEKVVDINAELQEEFEILEKEMSKGDFRHIDLDSFSSYWILSNIMAERKHGIPSEVYVHKKHTVRNEDTSLLIAGPFEDFSKHDLSRVSDDIVLTDEVYYETLLGNKDFVNNVLKPKWEKFKKRMPTVKKDISAEADYLKKTWQVDALIHGESTEDALLDIEDYTSVILEAIDRRANVIDSYLATL